MQHFSSVETAVRHALHNALKPSEVFESDLDYLRFDLDSLLHSNDHALVTKSVYYSFLRKWKGLDTGIDKSQVAWSAWLDAEHRCRLSNDSIYSQMRSGKYLIPTSLILRTQKIICDILGKLEYPRIAELCRFGTGATMDLKRGSTLVQKSWRPTITLNAIPYLCRVIANDRYLGSLVGGFNDLRIVENNRVVMVPKSAKTDRTIAAEPTLNGFVQQGIGRFIRLKLLRFGVDLNDQTVNQSLASRAISMDLATIDLSSASDTLCTALVKLLLPREWFEFLDSVRSVKSKFQGKNFHLQKFSSMGNAFTFELESLIFYALLRATLDTFPLPLHDSVISVYGDDLIIPSAYQTAVSRVLNWAGFKVNEEKSFYGTVLYRESCGKHYFGGSEVTPTYQKDICSRVHDFVRLHNRLVRLGIRLNLRSEVEAATGIVRRHVSELFPRSLIGIGPLVDYDEYFVRENYVWFPEFSDRVRVRSAIVITRSAIKPDRRSNYAYYARKLRCPAFLSPDHHGQVSESLEPKLVIRDKYHWRSASSLVDTASLSPR
jgi:hypothetical protein